MHSNNETLNDPFKKLENSPMFQVSLASKELFHSNFWAWLFNPDHSKFEAQKKSPVYSDDYIQAFFGKAFPRGKKYRVEREKHNIDLTIKITEPNSEQYFYIENKIKSVPNNVQLEKYAIDLKTFGNTPKFLLTSIVPPSDEIPTPWTHKGLSQIADEICEIAKKETDSYRRSIITDYANTLKHIYEVLNSNFVQEANVYQFNFGKSNIGYYNKLKKIRIHDLFLKQQGSNLMSHLLKKINAPNNNTELVPPSQAFHNGKNTFTFELKSKIPELDHFRIGIQIEGNQWRRFIAYRSDRPNELSPWIKKRTSDQERPPIVDKLIDLGWFCEAYKEFSNKRMRNQFCAYGSYFLHQYEDVLKNRNSDGKYTYTEIVNKLSQDLRAAAEALMNSTELISYTKQEL